MHVTRTGATYMTPDILFDRIAKDLYEPDDHGRQSHDFHEDLRAYLRDGGVPEQYVEKVAYAAWERGHSAGMFEVVAEAIDLAAIFTT